MNNAFTSNSSAADGEASHVAIASTSGLVVLGGNVFSVMEPGWSHRTSACITLAEGATALDMGNLYEGGSVHGLTNVPDSLRTRTRRS